MHDICRILVTGSNGFVGEALFNYLQEVEQYHVSGSVRTADVARENLFTVSELSENTDWFDALKGQHVVVHVAARAHVMDDSVGEPLAEYRRVNVAGTLNLARQAASAGVRRFIFISSIKVNGESTTIGSPFQHLDKAMPKDPYGISKSEAESGLWQINKESGMEIVIIRPPLVYGPGVKANFLSMMKLVSKNYPLPLGAICNRRSMVALDNLINLISTCINHPKAANQTFLVSDDHDISTTKLLEMMTQAAGKSPRLLPVPMSWLRLAGKLTGKQAVIERLCGNLQIDISHTKTTLGWQPPISLEEGVKRCFIEDKEGC